MISDEDLYDILADHFAFVCEEDSWEKGQDLNDVGILLQISDGGVMEFLIAGIYLLLIIFAIAVVVDKWRQK
jgi:hypothetical protein